MHSKIFTNVPFWPQGQEYCESLLIIVVNCYYEGYKTVETFWGKITKNCVRNAIIFITFLNVYIASWKFVKYNIFMSSSL